MTRTIFAMAVFAIGASASTFTGVITESMCVGDHKAMKIAPDPKCIVDCVKSSPSIKYVLFDGKTAYKLSDQQTPEKFAGQKVRVSGTLFEKTGIVKVDRIEAVR